MSLIFVPGKYLLFIFFFLDIVFSISPDIVKLPKYKCSAFPTFFIVLMYSFLSALLIFSVGVDWISFLVLVHWNVSRFAMLHLQGSS